MQLEISKKDVAIMERAAAEAKKASTFQTHRLGAVLIKGGRILAIAHNITDPLRVTQKHAEVRTLNKRQFDDVSDAILYVARLRRNQKWGLAMPCPKCRAAIKAAGIKYVYFTTNCPKSPIQCEAV
jgi:tRNA(adenine34) deaminase